MTTVTTAEETLKLALETLMELSDEAQSLDLIGFNGSDKQNTFINSLYNKRNTPYTTRMMLALRNVLVKYQETQLRPMGIILPTIEQVTASPITIAAPTITTPLVDVVNHFIIITFPYPQYAPNMQTLKEQYKQSVERYGDKYCGKFSRFSNEGKCFWDGERKRWQLPYTPATLRLVFKNFPIEETTLTLSGQEAYDQIENAEKLAREQQERYEARRREQLETLMALVPTEFTPGRKLYDHQIVGVKFLLGKGNGLVADEAGAGKTLEGLMAAYVLQQKYGYRIYVVSTLSSRNDWVRISETVGASVEIFTWAKMPIATNETPSAPFVIIFDEGHKMQDIETQQTQKAISLTWHPNCKHTFILTGTPIPNGRSINALGWLLALKHPLVYSPFENIVYPIIWKRPKAKKGETAPVNVIGSELPAAMKGKITEYQKVYCGAKSKMVSGRQIWWKDGATNQELFYRYTAYKDGQDNHPWACKIQRTKDECVSLPEKQRIPVQVEVTKQNQEIYLDTVEEGIERFKENCKTRLAEWIIEYTAEENQYPSEQQISNHARAIKSAEAMVLKSIYKRAASKAKVDHAIQQALTILDQGQKIVIFTSFKEVAKLIGDGIIAETGKKTDVTYITGDVKDTDRFKGMDDFQNSTGESRVIISTAAGGEAITLTAASYMIIVDRPWTPGQVEQWENRIHRLGITKNVTIYWLQLPESLTKSDIQIDALIEQKLIDINAMSFNVTGQGVKFTENIEDAALNIILDMKKRTRKR